MNRLAEETPVTDAPETTDASETTENNTEPSAETSANEVVTDSDSAPASNAAEPALNESLSPADGSSAQTERVEVENGRDYEVMFIVRITESTDAATERARAVIEQSGGVVDNVRVSEQRRLAYAIKKEIEGFYVVINGRFSKEAATELDRELKLDEAVLRHMTIRLDEE